MGLVFRHPQLLHQEPLGPVDGADVLHLLLKSLVLLVQLLELGPEGRGQTDGGLQGLAGQGLSQGQLQRLAIARAVCSGAPIMVLDEVTSALDNATEAAVLANIAQLPGKTVFVAAHRAKAREFATMRLHVEDGVLSEVR